MEKVDLFRDIAERTGGDIYLGVVGPVRTGKSTFIKRFMDLLVLPNIDNTYDRERAQDELPQSGAGRTIMTTEPKFIPAEGVEVAVAEGLSVKMRVVDCVGYSVDGALGYEEEEGPRMVRTPWFDYEIPFQEAAEIGTRKVIADHSTIGMVITTDGSITEIPREAYVEAEERVVSELKELDKPFLMVLNSTVPNSAATQELALSMIQKYDVPVVAVDCLRMSGEDIMTVLEELLFEFPVNEVSINLPQWVEELDSSHALRKKFEDAVQEAVSQVRRVRDIENAVDALGTYDFVGSVSLKKMDMGTGTATIDMTAREGLFWEVLAEVAGVEIEGEHTLMRLMRELTTAKSEFDKIADALVEVRETGYGVSMPQLDDMLLEEPELIRRGSQFGIRLKASAPSYHVIKANITTEITPIVGTERQSEELVRYMLSEFEESPEKIWTTNIFGKSVNDLMREGIQNKLSRMPENAQDKLQETVQRIVNEGSGGLICIII